MSDNTALVRTLTQTMYFQVLASICSRLRLQRLTKLVEINDQKFLVMLKLQYFKRFCMCIYLTESIKYNYFMCLFLFATLHETVLNADTLYVLK